MKAFTQAELPALFNEWMRRYIEEPERFEAEFQSVGLFLSQSAAKQVPTYGDTCTVYLDRIRTAMSIEVEARAAIDEAIFESAANRMPKRRRRKRAR